MKNYDLSNLSEEDVMDLIKYEKNPDKPLEYKKVYSWIVETLVFSNETKRCNVMDPERDIMYLLNVHTTPSPDFFSISLIFVETNRHLVRFDFGNTLRHTNNKGTNKEEIIVGSHVHFNAPPGKYDAKNVIPIGNIEEFVNLKTIHDAWNQFTRYANIVEK